MEGDHQFVRWDAAARQFESQPLGKAVLASGLSIEHCLLMKVGVAAVCLCGGGGEGLFRPAQL